MRTHESSRPEWQVVTCSCLDSFLLSSQDDFCFKRNGSSMYCIMCATFIILYRERRFCTRAHILLLFSKKIKNSKLLWKILKKIVGAHICFVHLRAKFRNEKKFPALCTRKTKWVVKIDLKTYFRNHWFFFFAHSAGNVFSFRKKSRVWTTHMCVSSIFFQSMTMVKRQMQNKSRIYQNLNSL